MFLSHNQLKHALINEIKHFRNHMDYLHLLELSQFISFLGSVLKPVVNEKKYVFSVLEEFVIQKYYK